MPSHKPLYSTTAIVLGRTNFGEADRIVRFLTPDRGKVSAVAKGVRKIKSRSGGHLELFGEVSLMCSLGRNLDIVTSAQLLWYPHALVGDYRRLELAFLIARAADRLIESSQPAPQLYALVRQALEALNDGAAGPIIELWFKLRLLSELGYRPELGACIACGDHTSGKAYAFSPERGGIVCPVDAGALDAPMSEPQIKFWRLLCDYPYGTISHVMDAATLATTTLALCDAFYEQHLGKQFRPSIIGD
jgi:DNA repair protein RecO (recombination protein O)